MTAPQQGLFGLPEGGEATYEQPAPVMPQMGVTSPQLMQSEPADNLDDYEDYWGFEQSHTFYMPDGKQTITYKTLTEGDIALFNKKLKRDVVVEKRTGDARFRMDQSEERHALLEVAVTGWALMRRGRQGWERAPFSTGSVGSELNKWINKANPTIVANLEAAIRKANPTLLSATPETIDAIDKQIDELTQQRQEILDRQRGEDSSATK